jgi:hypothetical protein
MKVTLKVIWIAMCGYSAAAAATAKVGNESDYTLTVLKGCRSESGATTCSNEVTGGSLILQGGYVCELDGNASDFASASSLFSAKLKTVIEADGWSPVNYQLMSADFLPRRILVLERRNGVLLDIFVCLFPMQNGKLGVSYTQGAK